MASTEAMVTIEQVLMNVFRGDFEKTLNLAGVAGARELVREQLVIALLLSSGTQIPTCPGFRDMVMSLFLDSPFQAGLGQPGGGRQLSAAG